MYANRAYHPQDPCWSLYRQAMCGSLYPWDTNGIGRFSVLQCRHCLGSPVRMQGEAFARGCRMSILVLNAIMTPASLLCAPEDSW